MHPLLCEDKCWRWSRQSRKLWRFRRCSSCGCGPILGRGCCCTRCCATTVSGGDGAENCGLSAVAVFSTRFSPSLSCWSMQVALCSLRCRQACRQVRLYCLCFTCCAELDFCENSSCFQGSTWHTARDESGYGVFIPQVRVRVVILEFLGCLLC